MSVSEPDQGEREVAELATGFAVGDLDEPGLKRLHELLTRPGEGGSGAARVCWEVLGTTLDLRAQLGDRFGQTVRHRVEAAMRGDDGRGFVGGVLARLGRRRPRLEAITGFPRAVQRSHLGLVVVVAGLLVATLAVTWWATRRSGDHGIARIVELDGTAESEGRFLVAGAAIKRAALTVPAGSRLVLAWPEGHRLSLRGPADAFPTAGGCSLSGGRAELATGPAPFDLVLSRRRLAVAADSRLAVELDGDQGPIGIAAGHGTVSSASARVELSAGQALDRGGTPYPWAVARLDALPDHGWTVPADRSARTWHLAFDVIPAARGDGILVVDDQGRGVRLAGGLVRAGQHETPLSGPPLRPRRVVIRAAPGTPPQLSVDGLPAPLPLELRGPALRLRALGTAAVTGISLHTGPGPLTDL